MLDETQEWQAYGALIASGKFSEDGPTIHARCADAETAEHIVRLHNEARGDGARTICLSRSSFGDPPVGLRVSSSDVRGSAS